MIKNQDEFDEHHRMLKSDLEALFKLVITYRKPVSEGDIRLASVILRKWLLDGQLSRLCNAARVKATFWALDNEQVCAALPTIPSINYFLTAGIRMNRIWVQAIYNAASPSTGKPLVPVDTLQIKEFTFREFLKQRRLYFGGAFFSCEDIIKFTANKLGGAHLDFDRPGAYAQLNKAASFMMYGGPANPQLVVTPIEVYMILEPHSEEILSGLHLEIIAAASSLIQVRLDGKPVVKLRATASLFTRVREWLWPIRPGSRLIGYGPENNP